MRDDSSQPALCYQEPQTCRSRTSHRGEEIDPHRVRSGQRYQTEYVGQNDEERIAGWVRDAEHFGRCDVLGRIPECCRRRQGCEIDREDDSRSQCRPEVGWLLRISGQLNLLTSHFSPLTSLVSELPLAGHDHGRTCLVRCLDDLGVTHGATWLDDRGDSRRGGLLHTIRKW